MEGVCDFIHIKRTGVDGTAYPLSKQSELVLGKSESCDFRVQVPSACDRHAKLRVDKNGKVFVTSLVPTAPVNLNRSEVLKETYIAHNGVISVGSCNFRFVYRDGFQTSPLQEDNRPAALAGKPRKSLGTPKSASRRDKENVVSSHSPSRKSLSRTPRDTGVAGSRPDTPTVRVKTPASKRPSTPTSAKPTGSLTKVPRPLTPTVPSCEKKGRTATPIVGRSRRSSTRSSRSSLVSISEEEEVTTPQASAKNTPANMNISTITSSKSTERIVTPTLRRSRSSRSRASSSMSMSLMSIQEEDESVAVSPSPSAAGKYLQHNLCTSASATSRWSELTTTNRSKRATRKSVSFGPALSPEVFNKCLPPSTPVKAGTVPGGLRRSLPAKLARSEALELVTEEDEKEVIDEQPEQEEEEGEEEGEYEEYSMTGFEETTSDEDSEEEVEVSLEEESVVEELQDTPVATPVIEQDLPIPTQISSGPSLMRRRRKLATPLRRAIEGRPRLRASRRKMPTPLRKAIKEKPVLRKTHRSLPTPVRSGIQNHSGLRKTRKVLSTPLRSQIQSKPELRKTKRSMPTPLRLQIQCKVELKKTKLSMPTPLRKAIAQRPSLRATKKMMPTPLRNAILRKPALRKTKRTLATPIRKEIEAKPTLCKTKKVLPTPVRLEIEGRPTLRKTRHTLATPIRKEIEGMPVLRKTKKLLPTPIRAEIQSRPVLRKTRLTLPTPLREDIQRQPQLRKTKRTLPTPLRVAIKQRPALRATKRSLPADLLTNIASGPKLRPTKQKLSTPLRQEIQRGVTLRSLPPASTHFKRAYSDTITACETPVPLPPAKRRKVAGTPLPYNFECNQQPGSNTPDPIPQPPAKRSKRDYAETVTTFETPVPAPPAKRMKVASTPALSTPVPYNFEAFIRPSNPVDLTGLPQLFKSPRECNSTDPADVFEVRLFSGSREVNFSSPLALTAKKPTSRPNSAQALQSCLKPTTQPCLFHIGTAEPAPKQRRNQPKRAKNSRSLASTTASTRVTRSSAKHEAPPSKPAIKRGRSGDKGKEDASPPLPSQTVRVTRSRAAITLKISELKPVHPVITPLPVKRNTQKMSTSTPQKGVSSYRMSTRSKRNAVPVLTEDVSTTRVNTRSRKENSKPDSIVNNFAVTRSAQHQVKEPSSEVAAPTTQRRATKTEHATAVVEQTPIEATERQLRHSRRLTMVPACQNEAGVSSQGKKSTGQKNPQQAKGVKASKKGDTEKRAVGTRRTRQVPKQTVVMTEEVAVKPSTRSSQKREQEAVPIRRSSRLRK